MKLYLKNLGEVLLIIACLAASLGLLFGVLWLLLILFSYSVLLGFIVITLLGAMIIAAVNTADEL